MKRRCSRSLSSWDRDGDKTGRCVLCAREDMEQRGPKFLKVKEEAERVLDVLGILDGPLFPCWLVILLILECSE